MRYVRLVHFVWSVLTGFVYKGTSARVRVRVSGRQQTFIW